MSSASRAAFAAMLVSLVTISAPTAQAGPLGVEFQVNTFTTGVQSTPAVATDGDGDSVVVWESADQDSSSTGVYGQRYSSTGVRAGGEFLVNTTVLGYQGFPDVAMDIDGDFVVVWEGGADGNFWGIFGQRFDETGVKQGAEFQVNTYTDNYQAQPSIAMDTNGGFVVTWWSDGQDGSGYGVYAQRFDASGAAQGLEFRVNTTTTGDQEIADVAMARDGSFVVAWDSFGQDGSTRGIYAQRYDAAGSVLGGEFQVNTFTTNNQWFPSVAVDAEGNFVISWVSALQDGSGNGVYAQRYSAAGTPQGSEFRVNDFTTGNQAAPSVASEADGDFVIAWESFGQDGADLGAFMRRFDAGGTKLGTETQLNSYTTGVQRFPQIALDEDGDLIATWSDSAQEGDGAGVFARRFAADSRCVQVGDTLEVDLSGEDSELTISTLGTGIWLSGISNNNCSGTEMNSFDTIHVSGSSGDDTLGISISGRPIGPGLAVEGAGISEIEFDVDLGSGGDQLFVFGSPRPDDIRFGDAGINLNGDDDADITYANVEAFLAHGEEKADILSAAGGLGTGGPMPAGVTLLGDEANDTLLSGLGSDGLDGGTGSDLVEYATSPAGVNVDLLAGTASGGTASGDTLISIERVTGSAFNDNLTGDAGPNTLRGSGGTDIIDGGDDADFISGGSSGDLLNGGLGKDTLDYFGSSVGVTVNLATPSASGGHATGDGINNFESVIGTALADNITGTAAANTIKGGAGGDTLNGGGGNDTLDYAGSTAGVTINLLTPSASGGHATGDVLTSFEFILGSSFGDSLTGTNGGNSLTGAGGNDSLFGLDGNDTLRGQGGTDTFDGGNGTDDCDDAGETATSCEV